MQYNRAFLTLMPMPDTTYRQVLAYDIHKKEHSIHAPLRNEKSVPRPKTKALWQTAVYLHYNKSLDVVYNKRFFQCQYLGHYVWTNPSVRCPCACHGYALYVRFDLSLRLWLPRYVRYAYVSPHPNVACFWRFLAHIVSFFCICGIVYHPYRGL